MTFITGLLQYEFDELCDCDFTGAPVFSVPFEEDYDQYSQEIRWVSAAGGTLEHIGGVYYQKSNLDFYDSIVIDSGIIPAAVSSRVRAQAIAAGDSPAVADAKAAGASAAIANTTTPRKFTSDAELWSVFW